MSTYTRRLGFVACTVVNQLYTIYVAPKGTSVLRDVVVTQFNTPGPSGIVLYLRPGPSGTLSPLWYVPAAPTGSAHIDMRQELVEGEQLLAAVTVTPVYIWATGYVFD